MENNIESNNLIYQIGLTKIDGIGNVLAKKLLEEFGSVENIFKASGKQLLSVRGISKNITNSILNSQVLVDAQKEVDFVVKNNINILFFNSPNYPLRLRECIDAPILLYYKGTANLDSKKIISIVGTRNASDYGRIFCESFLKELSSIFPDLLIISGLAYGIDINAHKAALQNSLPTIGVLAHGLDRIYPSVHRSVAVDMLKNGGLISEFNSGTEPDKFNFVRRNRIIAGLSDATIVVESNKKGGSLITADIANSYDREVFAVPGRIIDKESIGCNMIIEQNKAILLASVDSFIKQMRWDQDIIQSSQKKVNQRTLFPELDTKEQIIYDLLLNLSKPTHFNFISNQTGIPISSLMSLLINMEMKDVIISKPGNYFLIK